MTMVQSKYFLLKPVLQSLMSCFSGFDFISVFNTDEYKKKFTTPISYIILYQFKLLISLNVIDFLSFSLNKICCTKIISITASISLLIIKYCADL